MSRPNTVRRTILAALVLAAAASGCSDATAPEGVRVSVAISGTRFASGPNGTAAVPYVVTNRGADPVALVACGGVQVVVDRREDGRWTEGAMVCPAIFSQVAVPLAPGARVEGTAAVRGPGEFRLRVGAAPLSTRDGPDLLALPTSAAFVVE